MVLSVSLLDPLGWAHHRERCRDGETEAGLEGREEGRWSEGESSEEDKRERESERAQLRGEME